MAHTALIPAFDNCSLGFICGHRPISHNLTKTSPVDLNNSIRSSFKRPTVTCPSCFPAQQVMPFRNLLLKIRLLRGEASLCGIQLMANHKGPFINAALFEGALAVITETVFIYF